MTLAAEAPSGVDYLIYFGQAGPGTSSVALTDAQGSVGATSHAVKGWYAVYIASRRLSRYDNLSFFNGDGQVTGSTPLGP